MPKLKEIVLDNGTIKINYINENTVLLYPQDFENSINTIEGINCAIDMLSGIGLKAKIATGEFEPEEQENPYAIQDTIDLISGYPRFQLDRIRYRASFSLVNANESDGLLNVPILELTCKADMIDEAHIDKLVNVCRKTYRRADINLVYTYISNGIRTYIMSMSNNVKQFLDLAKGNIISNFEASLDFKEVSSTNSTISYRRVNSLDSRELWSPDLAKAVIEEQFDIEKILFIHPTLPIIVVNA